MRDGRGIIGIWLHADTIQSNPGERTEQTANVRTEGDRIAPQHPLDRNDADHDETVHDRAENIFAAHKPAIEKKQTRNRHH